MQVQKLTLALVALVLFTAYSVGVAIEHGPAELLTIHEQGGWSTQVFLDLVLALLGFFTLAAPDAKRLGIPYWPYFIAALGLGSISMLAYLVHRELRSLRQPALA